VPTPKVDGLSPRLPGSALPTHRKGRAPPPAGDKAKRSGRRLDELFLGPAEVFVPLLCFQRFNHVNRFG
jgi:hypothetical protein